MVLRSGKRIHHHKLGLAVRRGVLAPLPGPVDLRTELFRNTPPPLAAVDAALIFCAFEMSSDISPLLQVLAWIVGPCD